MNTRPRIRTRKIEVLLTPEEYEEIARQATKSGMTLSNFVRAATFAYLWTQGSRAAWRILVRNVGERLAELLVGRRRTEPEARA